MVSAEELIRGLDFVYRTNGNTFHGLDLSQLSFFEDGDFLEINSDKKSLSRQTFNIGRLMYILFKTSGQPTAKEKVPNILRILISERGNMASIMDLNSECNLPSPKIELSRLFKQIICIFQGPYDIPGSHILDITDNKLFEEIDLMIVRYNTLLLEMSSLLKLEKNTGFFKDSSIEWIEEWLGIIPDSVYSRKRINSAHLMNQDIDLLKFPLESINKTPLAILCMSRNPNAEKRKIFFKSIIDKRQNYEILHFATSPYANYEEIYNALLEYFRSYTISDKDKEKILSNTVISDDERKILKEAFGSMTYTSKNEFSELVAKITDRLDPEKKKVEITNKTIDKSIDGTISKGNTIIEAAEFIKNISSKDLLAGFNKQIQKELEDSINKNMEKDKIRKIILSNAVNKCHETEAVKCKDKDNNDIKTLADLSNNEKYSLASNGKLDSSVQRAFAFSMNTTLRENLALNKNINEETQKILANDPTWSVREILAFSSTTGESAQAILCADKCHSVRVALAENPNLSDFARDVLSEDKDLLDDPTVDNISKSKIREILNTLANNPKRDLNKKDSGTIKNPDFQSNENINKINLFKKNLIDEAGDSSIRILGKQTVKAVQTPIVGIVRRTKNKKIVDFSNSEYAKAIIGIAASEVLGKTSSKNEKINTVIKKLSKELKIEGLAVVGNELADIMKNIIKKVLNNSMNTESVKTIETKKPKTSKLLLDSGEKINLKSEKAVKIQVKK